MSVVAPSATSSTHRRVRPAFFAGFFTDFLAAFLAAVFFVGAFFETAFLTAFFTGAFLAAFLTSAFFVAGFGASLAGVNALVTVATAEPKAVFTEPATSSAIANPYPTFSAAFSTIVFSAIFQVPSRCSFAAAHLAVYPRYRTSFLISTSLASGCLAGILLPPHKLVPPRFATLAGPLRTRVGIEGTDGSTPVAKPHMVRHRMNILKIPPRADSLGDFRPSS